MLDLNEVKNQTHINSDEVTREEAAEISSAEKWAPHLSDGLDAFERAHFQGGTPEVDASPREGLE